MILIGSYAAKLGGFYPEWRDCEPGDIDLACREGEIADLGGLLGEPRRIAPDQYRWITGGPSLDVTVHSDGLIALMERLSGDPIPVNLHPERPEVLAYVSTPEIVWSTLYLTAGCAPAWWDKSWRDLEHYDALVERGGLVTDDHWTIARHYRRMMFRRITEALA